MIERVDWLGPYGRPQEEIVRTLFTKVMWSIRKERSFRTDPEKSQILSHHVKKYGLKKKKEDFII